jgi:hypothetical protein
MVVFQLLSSDRRQVAAPLDARMRTLRREPVRGVEAVARHYLPIGATDVVAQAPPHLPELGTYSTIYGTGHYVDDRQHGDAVTFELPVDRAGAGGVRLFDARDEQPATGDVSASAADVDPAQHLGWSQVYGPQWPRWRADMPVMDNGRCRVRYEGGGALAVEVCRGGRYTPAATVHTGYPDLVTAAVVAWSPERAVVRCVVAGTNTRGEADVVLQRGWPGPQVDVYHQGERHGHLRADGVDAHTEEAAGWSHLRVASRREALYQATVRRRVLPR